MFFSLYVISQTLLTCGLESFGYNGFDFKIYVDFCVLSLLLLGISFMLLFELEFLLFR